MDAVGSGDGVRRRRRPTRALVALAAALGMVGGTGVVAHRTEAAFTATTSAAARWTTATVVLDGSTAGAVMDLRDLQPGSRGDRCVTVRYTGTATPVQVRLWTTAVQDTAGLGAHVQVVVREAVGVPEGLPCTDVAGTQVFSGSLAQLTSGVVDRATGLGAWAPTTTPATATYRFSWTVGAEPPQSATARFGLTWEART